MEKATDIAFLRILYAFTLVENPDEPRSEDLLAILTSNNSRTKFLDLTGTIAPVIKQMINPVVYILHTLKEIDPRSQHSLYACIYDLAMCNGRLDAKERRIIDEMENVFGIKEEEAENIQQVIRLRYI
jgi:hypothetical protein